MILEYRNWQMELNRKLRNKPMLTWDFIYHQGSIVYQWWKTSNKYIVLRDLIIHIFTIKWYALSHKQHWFKVEQINICKKWKNKIKLLLENIKAFLRKKVIFKNDKKLWSREETLFYRRKRNKLQLVAPTWILSKPNLKQLKAK